MNAVYVSLNYFSDDKRRDAFLCDSFNWLHGQPPDNVAAGSNAAGEPLYVKVRHGENVYECVRFEVRDGGRAALVQLPQDDQGLAAGQFAVFYRAGVCLGSGVIAEGVPRVEGAGGAQ